MKLRIIMEESPVKYERHIFVCINEKQGKQCCGPDGGWDLLKALREHVNSLGLFHKYNISKAKCLGQCLKGPAICVQPDGKTFTNVTPEDVKEIIDKFLK